MSTAYILLALAVVFVIWVSSRNRKKDSHTDTYYNPIKPQEGSTLNSWQTSSYAPADGYQDQNQNIDNWEGSFWEASNPIDIKASLQLVYIDGNKNKTERSVDVKKFDSKLHEGMLIGYCHLRKATRTFRFDRILMATDLETGEVINNVGDWLLNKYKSSPEHSADQIFAEDYDCLRILLYVAKADGQFRKAELEVIANLCREISGNENLTNELVKRNYEFMDVPTYRAFQLAVGRVAKEKSQMAGRLIESAEKIIKTQPTIHPLETQALEYLKTKLS